MDVITQTLRIDTEGEAALKPARRFPSESAAVLPSAQYWHDSRRLKVLGMGTALPGPPVSTAVLEPQQNPRLAQLSEDSEERFIMSSARPRFDLAHYEEILKNSVPRLIGATGVAGFHLMCDLLDQALSLEPRREEDPRPWDFSYIWRPAIEDIRQSNLPDLKSTLVSAVRDAAEILIPLVFRKSSIFSRRGRRRVGSFFDGSPYTSSNGSRRRLEN